ncbi:MATE family efflux transporter [Streptomyces sp. A7024]|uniref:Probable multidrug resistance protein NorM n=1 Tax=Streptomyces coryli TaxID=1128680 RepID=A0A6G4U9C9_9ACTN|nr:MATE family efflux transporter [Streptomyces coryli]NGN68612.1 MATE family efflux transporter [Streptomyces coryli]
MTDVQAERPAIPGDLGVRVRRLAVPISLGVVTGLGAQFAISALLGNMGGAALYVRALFIPIAFVFLALEEGIEISSQVIAARQKGADAERRPPVVRLGAFALGCFLVLAVVVAVLAPQMARTLDVSAEHTDTFVLFARLVVAAYALAVLNSVVAGTLRGWGLARSASAITITVAVTQVLGVWLLDEFGGLGVYAVPWSIAISSVITLAAGLFLLVRTGMLRDRGPVAEPRAQTLQVLAAVGIPVSIAYLLISAMNYTSLWVLSGFGKDAVAGYGAAQAVQVLCLAPAIALGSAAAITMNQSLGAGETHLLRPVVLVGVRYALAVYAVIGIAVFALAGPLGDFMSGDDGTADFASSYLSAVSLSWVAFGLITMLNMTLQQVRSGQFAIATDLAYLLAVNVGGGLIARAMDEPKAYFAALAIGNFVIGGMLLAVAWRRYGRLAEAAA